jgi:hypothetical protein
MNTKSKKTTTAEKQNENVVKQTNETEFDEKKLSKIGIYWRTEYRKGWIKDMRAVLK